jgi:hypothetical protein
MSHELPPSTAAGESVPEVVPTVSADHTPTGAGSEAAEGIHGSGIELMGERSALDSRDTGRSFRAGADRAGSEPLVDRDWVHESGYGGKGGAPRTSSDQREPEERASGVSLVDASEAIDAHPPSPLHSATGQMGHVRTLHLREHVVEPAASSDAAAPDPKASQSK